MGRYALGGLWGLCLVIGCGGDPPATSSCSAFGQACMTGCCSPYVCNGTTGVCAMASTSSTVKSTCTTEACKSGVGSFQVCVTSGAPTYYKTSDGTKYTCSSTTSASCETAASAVATWCQNAKVVKLPTAWPCTADSQCAAPNLCYSGITGGNEATGNSWCSGNCLSDDGCGDYAWCVADNLKHYRCFPNCNSTADCAIFGAGITCQPTTTIQGEQITVCTG